MTSSDLTQRVLRSVFFKLSQQRAASYIKNRARIIHLLGHLGTKLQHVPADQLKTGFLDNVKTLSRMVKAWHSGDYRMTPWTTLLKIVAVLIYFVSPFDFLPDLLPVVGLTDDIALVMWAVHSFSQEVEKFRTWEKEQTVMPANG